MVLEHEHVRLVVHFAVLAALSDCIVIQVCHDDGRGCELPSCFIANLVSVVAGQYDTTLPMKPMACLRIANMIRRVSTCLHTFYKSGDHHPFGEEGYALVIAELLERDQLVSAGYVLTFGATGQQA